MSESKGCCKKLSCYMTHGAASKFKGNAGGHKLLNNGFDYKTKEFNMCGKGHNSCWDFEGTCSIKGSKVSNTWKLSSKR